MLKPNTEHMVITDLRRSGNTLLAVLDRDTKQAMQNYNAETVATINSNLRTLAAINEVLLYYGDAGVFGGAL